MSTTLLRITFAAPLVALALVAFTVALLIEWLGDITHSRPSLEKQS